VLFIKAAEPSGLQYVPQAVHQGCVSLFVHNGTRDCHATGCTVEPNLDLGSLNRNYILF